MPIANRTRLFRSFAAAGYGHPYAVCYSGHWFGGWVGQLGGGWMINLGEIVNRNTGSYSSKLPAPGRILADGNPKPEPWCVELPPPSPLIRCGNLQLFAVAQVEGDLDEETF